PCPFERLKRLRVIGDIFGLLFFGPTVFCYLFPASANWIFSAYPSEGQLLSLVSWFGLILLMFISGVEIHGTFNREDKRTAVALLLVVATGTPLQVGQVASSYTALSLRPLLA